MGGGPRPIATIGGGMALLKAGGGPVIAGGGGLFIGGIKGRCAIGGPSKNQKTRGNLYSKIALFSHLQIHMETNFVTLGQVHA